MSDGGYYYYYDNMVPSPPQKRPSPPDDARKKRDSDEVDIDTQGSAEKSKKLRSVEHRISTKQPVAASTSRVWDLESALHRIVRLPEPFAASKFIRYRLGHSGDASILATLYEHHHHPPTSATTDTSSLEVRLAEGLGDEDNPPSLYALLAEDEESSLVAVALLTLAWREHRVLRVEWLHVEASYPQASLLERRLWLRLSTLALLIRAGEVVVVVDPNTKK